MTRAYHLKNPQTLISDKTVLPLVSLYVSLEWK